MKALVLNCTLMRSPERSNTGALASVLATALHPVAYNHVAGAVVTGNEDGAHHVISEISGRWTS